MFKRELKINFKSFLIWIGIIIAMFLLIFLVYPSIMADAEAMKKLLEMFPSDILAAFNMDIVGIESFYGWCATEGQMFIGIMGGCFSIILGSTIVLKEKNDKTLEFLWSKPVTRNKILTSKIISGLVYVFLFSIIVYLCTTGMFLYNNEGSIKDWTLIMLGALLAQTFFYSLGIFISMFYLKTRKSMATGLGIVIGSFILTSMAKMAKQLEFLKYFSPFSYVDSRSVLTSGNYDILNIAIISIATLLLIAGSYFIYNKQEI